MALEVWRPGRGLLGPFFADRDLRRFEREMDRFFDDFVSCWRPTRSAGETCYMPACDLEETDNHYLVSFDLPGVPKDEVTVEIMGNQLCVSGERKREYKEEKKRDYRWEREHGRFSRIFTLPSEVNPDRVEANFQDGVLRIAIPKSEAAKSRTRQIKIGEAKSGWWERLTGIGEGKLKEIPVTKSAA